VRSRNSMLIVGLTGRIGTGKSEAARILERLGASVIDADRLGHQVYLMGAPAYHRIVAEYGREILEADGEIDRTRLGAVVFRDSARRNRLEEIVWPHIREALERRIEVEQASSAAPALVVDAAVLFQAGWDDLCDEVWLMSAPRDEVLARLRSGRGLTEAEAQRRLAAQVEHQIPREKVSAVIENARGLDDLTEQVERLWADRVTRKA